MATVVEQRLKRLAIELPAVPSVAGHYASFTRVGEFVQLAGVAPTVAGAYAVVGKIGRDLTLEDGRRAAKICALNLIATLHQVCSGDLDRVRRIVMMRGFVNA